MKWRWLKQVIDTQNYIRQEKDENWEYANYQLDKIRTAIENGIERRPKRAQSAQAFLQHPIPAMKEPINKKDTAIFNKNFFYFSHLVGHAI